MHAAQATLWNHVCMSSLAAFLRRQPHIIQSLEVSTHDQDLGGDRESLAVRSLSQSLPPSTTALELSGGVALPLMMHSAAHLPCLATFKARRLPGKFSYLPGQFPWLEPESLTLMEGRISGPDVSDASLDPRSPASIRCLSQCRPALPLCDMCFFLFLLLVRTQDPSAPLDASGFPLVGCPSAAAASDLSGPRKPLTLNLDDSSRSPRDGEAAAGAWAARRGFSATACDSW